MTIETTLTKAQFLGNGAATVFPLPFPLLRPEHLFLVLTDLAGEQDTPVTANYRVDGCGTSGGPGASVVYPLSGAPLPAGFKLTAYRLLPFVQRMDLENGGAFDAEVIEAQFDYLMMLMQQLNEQSARALSTAITSAEIPSEMMERLLAAHDAAVAAASAASESGQNAAASAAAAVDSAARARADADRAAALVDPASLASSVYNVRKAFVVDTAVASGGVLTLPGCYYPTRDVLFLMCGGVACTPRLPMVEASGRYQYEEIGTDPNAASDRIRVWFDVAAGDVFDMWVVASAAGRNVEEVEALVARASAYAGEAAQFVADAAARAALAREEASLASVQANRAEAAALNLPDLGTAGDGQVIVARGVGGVMEARYENPPSPPVAEAASTLPNDIAAGDAYAVPAYIVGARKLQIHMGGVRCERGDNPAAAFYREVGASGETSTTITFHQDLSAGTQITAISAA